MQKTCCNPWKWWFWVYENPLVSLKATLLGGPSLTSHLCQHFTSSNGPGGKDSKALRAHTGPQSGLGGQLGFSTWVCVNLHMSVYMNIYIYIMCVFRLIYIYMYTNILINKYTTISMYKLDMWFGMIWYDMLWYDLMGTYINLIWYDNMIGNWLCKRVCNVFVKYIKS